LPDRLNIDNRTLMTAKRIESHYQRPCGRRVRGQAQWPDRDSDEDPTVNLQTEKVVEYATDILTLFGTIAALSIGETFSKIKAICS
jgi:hypothetical protein